MGREPMMSKVEGLLVDCEGDDPDLWGDYSADETVRAIRWLYDRCQQLEAERDALRSVVRGVVDWWATEAYPPGHEWPAAVAACRAMGDGQDDETVTFTGPTMAEDAVAWLTENDNPFDELGDLDFTDDTTDHVAQLAAASDRPDQGFRAAECALRPDSRSVPGRWSVHRGYGVRHEDGDTLWCHTKDQGPSPALAHLVAARLNKRARQMQLDAEAVLAHLDDAGASLGRTLAENGALALIEGVLDAAHQVAVREELGRDW